MRPRFVAAVLLFACAALATIATLTKTLLPQINPVAVAPANTQSDDSVRAKATALAVARKSLPRTPESAPATVSATDDEPQESIQVLDSRRRITELNSLAKTGDAAAQSALLAELQNQDKETREAALKAIIQIGDRSMIPYLQQIAAQTEGTAEQLEITKAIEYIELPSLTERLVQQNGGAPKYQR